MDLIKKVVGYFDSRTIITLVAIVVVLSNPGLTETILGVLVDVVPDSLDSVEGVVGDSNNLVYALLGLAAYFRVNVKANLKK